MKILILRFSSIGDIVLTSPVIRCLKSQSGAEVHFLTKAVYADVVRHNPYIDRVWTFDKKINECTRELQAENFDEIIDLHHNFRSWQLKRALGKPAHNFNKINFRKWLRVTLHIDLLPRLHIVHRYMETVAHLGIRYDGLGLDFFVPENKEADLTSLHPALEPNGYLALVIGATHATKRLPEEKLVELCHQTTRPILLLGGKSEADAGIAVAAHGGFHVINACGKLSLFESASVIRQAAAVISHDTGLMHIAAAYRKPVISIWGNTIPEFGMYPFYPDGMQLNTSLEVKGLRCRPCSKIGFKKCPKNHFKCMMDQSFEAVHW